MGDDKLVPLQHYLDDPVVVAVADAWVRTDYVSGTYPVWNTLAEKMANVHRLHGDRSAEHAGWAAVREATRFIEMYRAMMNAMDPDFREIEGDE